MNAVPEEQRPVAYLTFGSTAHPDVQRDCAIFAHDEFDIGRPLVRELLGLEERSISTHHLRIRCVMYDDETEQNRVAPMIYMRVLSNNSIMLRRNGLDGEDGGLNVTKDHGDVLLNDGDYVKLTFQIAFHFTDDTVALPPPFGKVRQDEIARFSSEYRLTKRVLGVGAQAAVYVAVKQSSGQQFACKILPLPTRSSEGLRRQLSQAEQELEKKQKIVMREYSVLKNLSHPNIISLEKVFRMPKNIYIFQELITGGDLISYLDKKGPQNEPQAAIIARQLLEAVKYLHANGVVHRDIKPENILMTSWRDGARIVLTDFGQSRTLTSSHPAAKVNGVFRMQTMVGTPGYVAPEVYRYMDQNGPDGTGYSKAVDIYSVGCVTGTLLTNDFLLPREEEVPFGSTFEEEIEKNLCALDAGDKWKHISKRAKSFVRMCLSTDETLRPTAAESLQFPWFQHKCYREAFDAAYKRAIQDWKPREQDDNVVEEIIAEDIPSHHFAVQKPLTPLTPIRQSTSNMRSTMGQFRAAGPQVDVDRVPDTPPFDFLHDDSLIEPPPVMKDTLPINSDAGESFFEQTPSLLPPPPAALLSFTALDQRLELATQNSARNSIFTRDRFEETPPALKRTMIHR